MNADVKNAIKDALILLAITLIAGLALGGVHVITLEPIERQKELAVANSCKAVFPDEEGFPHVVSFIPAEDGVRDQVTSFKFDNGVSVGNLYYALDDNGNRVGSAIEVTSGEGYGGDIKLMCGVTNDGTLRGVSILEISETAGLGMKAGTVLVPQLHNISAGHITFTKTGSTSESEIDAISGATITTTAFVNIVNAALDVSGTINPEGGAS